MSTAMERRMAPRFAVRCKAELASGTSVTEVDVSDMSVMGCGIEIEEDPSRRLGVAGVLAIQSESTGSPAVMLPVIVSNHRPDGERSRFGLRFPRLTLAQMRDLITVMDQAMVR